MSRTGQRTKSKKRTLLTLWILLMPILAIIAAIYVTNNRPDQSAIGGPFSMQKADGSTITETFFQNQSVTFVFFGYTNCPDICPTSLATLAAALDGIPAAKQNQTKTLFVSLDPDRDSGSDLDEYAKLFHPTFIGVTGSRQQIDGMVSAYKAFYTIGQSEDKDIYPVDHTTILYLMGSDGAYIAHFGSDVAPEQITQKLLELL